MATTTKPSKPSPDFPLFAHASGQWAKKIKGKTVYFGSWDDPEAALANFNGSAAPKITSNPTLRKGAAKPHSDFPLFAHASGQWAKKIRGKTHYFGSWDDPDAALKAYLDDRDELLAGRVPDRGDGLTVKELVNAFLAAKEGRVNSGELSPRTFEDYFAICQSVLEQFGRSRRVQGLRPSDFEKLRQAFATTHGPHRLSKDVTCVRTLFKWCDDHYDIRVKVGDGFKKPGKSILRRLKQSKPKKMFEAAELRAILNKASTQLKAMVLLGVNAGLGNKDIAVLTTDRINGNWLDYPRAKTAVPRRAPLWPETIQALEAVATSRPKPKDDAHKNLVFVTRTGAPWEGNGRTAKGRVKVDSPIANEFAKLVAELKLQQTGRGFYSCRHTFNTIALRTRDREATRLVMGHAEGADDMTAVYNEEAVSDERLTAVSDYVRAWLFSQENNPS